jgi:hypothetical protein
MITHTHIYIHTYRCYISLSFSFTHFTSSYLLTSLSVRTTAQGAEKAHAQKQMLAVRLARGGHGRRRMHLGSCRT